MILLVDQRRGSLIALDSLNDGATFKRLIADVDNLGPMRRPSGIAFNGAGRLMVADSGNNRVLALDPDTGSGMSLDPGLSEVGPLRQPTDVAISSVAQLVVSDTTNHRLVFLEMGETWEWSAFGIPGHTGAGEFEAPAGVHFDGGDRILIADPGAGRLVRFDAADGSGWTEIGLPPARHAMRPYGLAAGPDGGVLVSDLLNSRVLLVSLDDSVSVLIDGQDDRSVVAPVSMSMVNGDILVADAATSCISRWVVDRASGVWSAVQRLDYRGGGLGGRPEFSSLSGMAIQEQT